MMDSRLSKKNSAATDRANKLFNRGGAIIESLKGLLPALLTKGSVDEISSQFELDHNKIQEIYKEAMTLYPTQEEKDSTIDEFKVILPTLLELLKTACDEKGVSKRIFFPVSKRLLNLSPSPTRRFVNNLTFSIDLEDMTNNLTNKMIDDEKNYEGSNQLLLAASMTNTNRSYSFEAAKVFASKFPADVLTHVDCQRRIDYHGTNAATIAAQKGSTSFIKHVVSGLKESKNDQYIAQFCNLPNLPTAQFSDQTPLMIAAKCGHPKTVKFLLEHHADVSAVVPLERPNKKMYCGALQFAVFAAANTDATNKKVRTKYKDTIDMVLAELKTKRNHPNLDMITRELYDFFIEMENVVALKYLAGEFPLNDMQKEKYVGTKFAGIIFPRTRNGKPKEVDNSTNGDSKQVSNNSNSNNSNSNNPKTQAGFSLSQQPKTNSSSSSTTLVDSDTVMTDAETKDSNNSNSSSSSSIKSNAGMSSSIATINSPSSNMQQLPPVPLLLGLRASTSPPQIGQVSSGSLFSRMPTISGTPKTVVKMPSSARSLPKQPSKISTGFNPALTSVANLSSSLSSSLIDSQTASVSRNNNSNSPLVSSAPAQQDQDVEMAHERTTTPASPPLDLKTSDANLSSSLPSLLTASTTPSVSPHNNSNSSPAALTPPTSSAPMQQDAEMTPESTTAPASPPLDLKAPGTAVVPNYTNLALFSRNIPVASPIQTPANPSIIPENILTNLLCGFDPKKLSVDEQIQMLHFLNKAYDKTVHLGRLERKSNASSSNSSQHSNASSFSAMNKGSR